MSKKRKGRSSVGRNDPCPCGSGKKLKKCHQRWITEGTCYEDAYFYCENNWDGDPADCKLVICHGEPTGQGGPVLGEKYSHAWVEEWSEEHGLWIVHDHTNGRKADIPRFIYYQAGEITAEEVCRFTLVEAIEHVHKSGIWGPWYGEWYTQGCAEVAEQTEASKT